MTYLNRNDFATPQSNPAGVSAYFLRQLLEISQQQLLPNMYRKFCEETGLGAYSEHLPEPTRGVMVPVSFGQISQFMAKIYSVTRDGVYPLFCHNVGVGWANQYISSGAGAEQKAKFEPIFKDWNKPLEEKLYFYSVEINKLPKVLSQVLIPDGKVILLDCKDCAYCRDIQTAKMVCNIVKGFFSTTMKYMTGIIFTSEQLKSVARGDESCLHRFTPALS